MAVTEEAPLSIKRGFLKHTLGTLSLSFTKGNRDNLNLNFVGETLELLGRVNTRSHNEDNRRLRSRLFVDFSHGGGLSAGKVSSLEEGVYEVDNSESNSIRSEASEDDHLFHIIITLACPFSRKLSLLGVRLGGGEPTEPFLSVELNSSSEALEELNLLL
jgi:hypothetical protein